MTKNVQFWRDAWPISSSTAWLLRILPIATATKLSYTANKSRPAWRHYWPFPTTRLEFSRFSSDNHNFFFFYWERKFSHLLVEGDWVVGGGPVTAGEWRLRAVAAPPWVFPAWWGRASWARQVTACTRAASRTGRAVPQVRRGREAFEVLIANCKQRARKRLDPSFSRG